MKKFGFLIVPLLVIIMGSAIAPRLLAGGTRPTTLIFVGIGLILFVSMIRPKKAATKSLTQVGSEILDDFCKDAFTDNPALEKKFQAALSDIGNNLPKTAGNKLKKIEAECTTDPQKYALALASARVYQMSQDWKNVIREYNKAIVLHPTAKLAYSIGDCNQRLGNLDKAKDSYEFAMELDPTNPQYPSSLGTVCVGNGDYDDAMDYAQDALDIDSAFPQALATMAICYGVKNDSIMYKHYTDRAGDAGYSQDKIETTVKALRKREK